jgi:hypothetical protein
MFQEVCGDKGGNISSRKKVHGQSKRRDRESAIVLAEPGK